MIVLRHDGSFDGFLTAVFNVYQHKFSPVHLTSGRGQVGDLFARNIEIATEDDKAARVFAKLQRLFKAQGLRYFLRGALFETPERDDVLLGVIQHAIAAEPVPILGDYANRNVLRLSQFVKSVNREQHRVKAFVRFSKTVDEQFVAPIAPDYDVLPLVAPFFANRYADQLWTIADVKRHYAIYYDLQRVQTVELSSEAIEQIHDATLAENEAFYQALWQEYFQATTIRERQNRRLHLQQMPTRYWRYLTEKQRTS